MAQPSPGDRLRLGREINDPGSSIRLVVKYFVSYHCHQPQLASSSGLWEPLGFAWPLPGCGPDRKGGPDEGRGYSAGGVTGRSNAIW